MAHLRGLVGLVAAFPLLACCTAAGSRSESTSSSSASNHPATASSDITFSSSTTSVFTSPAPACAAGAIHVALVPGLSGATGERGQVLGVMNDGPSRCVVRGYPTVRLFDGSGAEIPFRYEQGGGPYLTGKPPGPVTLTPGAEAYFVIAKYRCDVNEAVRAVTVRVILPGQAASPTLRLPTDRATIADVGYCIGNGTPDPGDTIEVSPLRATGADF